jgi:hypothetical protein
MELSRILMNRYLLGMELFIRDGAQQDFDE